MHPLQPDITSLSDQELESKVNELTKKYFVSLRFSSDAARQIAMLLEGYKWEQERRVIEKEKHRRESDTDFGDLIKVE